MKSLNRIFWNFVHNALIHPLMAFPVSFDVVTRLHDWTANKAYNKNV